MAFVLGFETVAGDRGRGVLQSVLNQPVKPRAVVTAKFLAGTIVLGSAVLVVTFALLGAASVAASTATVRAVVPVAAVMDIVALFYLMSLMAASMAVGSVSASQAACVATLGALWTYVAILAPQFSVLGSRALVPVKARQLVEIDRQRSFEVREKSTQLVAGQVYRSVVGPLDLNQRTLPTPDEAGLAELRRAWRAEALDTRRIVEAFDQRFGEQLRERATVRSWLKWLSPGSLLYEATADLADTGSVASARWRARVWAHQQYVDEAFFDDPPRVPMYVPVTGGITMMQANFKLHSDVLARDLKAFMAPRVGWRDRIAASLPELIGLLAFVGIGVGLTYAVFPKTGV
jgi:hypothetical protein